MAEDKAKRGPGRPADRVSLQPLDFEEALKGLLATGPAPDDGVDRESNEERKKEPE